MKASVFRTNVGLAILLICLIGGCAAVNSETVEKPQPPPCDQAFAGNISQKVDPMWIKQLQLAAEKNPDVEIKEKKTLVVQTEVAIAADGSLKETKITTSSGYPFIDQAAIEAWKAAAPFPTPPAGCLDPQGLLRMRLNLTANLEQKEVE